MLTVKYPIVVEGKYDKIKLSSLVKAEIIQTDGFRIFSKKETMALLRRLAEKSKLIIMTDSDGGGTVIACGTPEEVAACENSYTGQYLRRKL